MRRRREEKGPLAPSVASSLGGNCERCGHARFIHSEREDHPCLFNECRCSDRWGNVRVIGEATGVMPGERSIELVARRDGKEIVATLAAQVAAQRAARLTSAGWAVELRASGGDVA
jgi:hypothetical protein